MAHKPSHRAVTGRLKAEALKDSTDPADFDLCAAFDLEPLRDAAHCARRHALSPLAASASVDTVTREFWIAFCPPQFHAKKDGTITEKKMKVTLIALTVMINTGNAAPVAMFRATNRGATVIKHPVKSTDGEGKEKWTGPRVPLCEVNRELVRLLGADAAAISVQLAALQPVRREKVREARPIPVPAEGRTPAGGRTPEWQAKRERHESAEVAPLTDKQIEALSDEDFAAHLAATFASMDVTMRAGTPEFWSK